MHLIILLHLCQLGSQNNHFPTSALFFLSLFQNLVTGSLSTLMLTLAFCIDQLTKRENSYPLGKPKSLTDLLLWLTRWVSPYLQRIRARDSTHASKQALTELRPYQDWHLWMYLCLREIIFSCRLTKAWQWHQIRFLPSELGLLSSCVPLCWEDFYKDNRFLAIRFPLRPPTCERWAHNEQWFVCYVCLFFFFPQS